MKLNEDNGAILTDKSQILNKLQQFYTDLYRSKAVNTNNNNNYFQRESPKLSEEQKEYAEERITEQDILTALKSTNKNKSPGSDGMPSEFYKVFWNNITIYIMDSINHSLITGSLSITQKHGIISLLPKPGRDKLWPKKNGDHLHF